MHGNVWEWCLDQWHSSYKGAPVDGSAWISGGNDRYCVLRGGSWSRYPWSCRAAYRRRDTPGSRYNAFGLQVVSVLA